MRNKAKKVWALILVFTFFLSITTVGFAQDQFKQLTAWFGDIKIVSNSQLVATDVQPFIVDGTTYVPVRMMANIFNKEIGWNGDTHTIIVNDKPNNDLTALRQQLDGKNFQISQLLARIDELETELEDDDDDLIDIDDLEDNLNDDYDEYEDIKFEIFLDGDEDDIEVTIEVDLDDYDTEWDDLSDSDIEDYLQDIVDDILYEYEDADIEGTIEDIADDEELVSFTVSSRGDVEIEDDDLSDLEAELDDDYYDYFDDIELSIELDGDEDDITFYINIDYDEYEDEWDDLTDSQIRTLMSYIYDDIEDEYEDADIEGFVYDTYEDEELAEYYMTSSGTAVFDRY